MSGIDYGRGLTNIDHNTGIRYGVIPANDVTWWHEESEANYGEPHCPKCGDELGGEANPEVGKDYYCEGCKCSLWADECFGDEPLEFYINNDEIQASQSGDDYDIFVIKSEFYTKASFCSPCAPGACYLRNPSENGEKAYCFGHDWFDGNAPYPVYKVSDDSLVLPE